jgi:hypothetical protein
LPLVDGVLPLRKLLRYNDLFIAPSVARRLPLRNAIVFSKVSV